MNPYGIKDSLDIPVEFKYQEAYLPTPRCRKYRYRPAKDTTVYEVPLFNEADAVLAFQHPEGYCENEHIKSYYAYGGLFWTRSKSFISGEHSWATEEGMVQYVQYHFFDSIHSPSDYHIVSNHDECIEAIHNTKLGIALMVTANGERWVMEEIGEPMYCICTFGLGHNHASTCLSVQNGYNPNIQYTRYFNALQKDAAVAEAKRIALARGDTDSVDKIPSHWDDIKVLAPECVTRNPAADYGGQGDSFINSVEAAINDSGSMAESAALSIAILGKAMK